MLRPARPSASVHLDRPGAGYRASMVGQKARSLLDSPGFSGRVLAVVHKAIYLEGSGGEILWITPPEQPAHTRAVVSSRALPSASIGERFILRDGSLYLGERPALDLAGTDVWKRPVVGPKDAAPLPIVLDRFRSLSRWAEEAPKPDESFAVTMPVITEAALGGEPGPLAVSDPFVHAAMGSISGEGLCTPLALQNEPHQPRGPLRSGGGTGAGAPA